MEVFLKSILYLLTFAGAAAVISFYISDIRMNRKRFRWYYYLPAAAVFAVLGGLCSHIFVWWLYLLSEAGSVSVLLLLGYLILIIGCLIGFALLFRRRKDFSKPFYFSLSVYALIMSALWMTRLFF